MDTRLLVIVPLALLTTACSGMGRINGSLDVAAGQPLSDARTVNGSIRVAPGAQIEDGSTINGSITLGARASAASLRAINGRIALDRGAHVATGVESINGAVTLSPGASISGHLESINGRVDIGDASVGGGVETFAGDVDIHGHARVAGGLLVHKPGSGRWFHLGGGHHVPRIVIGPGATVSGTLKFERPVKLYLSDHATVGSIVGATPIRFSGDRPPNS
jgi:hypothetical protein